MVIGERKRKGKTEGVEEGKRGRKGDERERDRETERKGGRENGKRTIVFQKVDKVRAQLLKFWVPTHVRSHG